MLFFLLFIKIYDTNFVFNRNQISHKHIGLYLKKWYVHLKMCELIRKNVVGDWSLITGWGGGLQNGSGGGAREVLPLRKGGQKKF